MAVTEDAASVLEQFIHDVANLPAEIAHLYEEANAKQDAINSLNGIIATKDGQLQKWVKSSSALVKHPKEETINKDILEAYTKVALIQDEKLALVQKACSLLDRYVKRLDVKIRDLQADGAMPLDNRMPSLLRQSEGNLVAIDSNTSTGANTPNPLQPLSINTNTSSFAQSAINRLAHATSANRVHSATTPVHPLHQTQSASTPTSTVPLAANARTQPASALPNDPKKRRLNLGPLVMPAAPNGSSSSSITRHASLGPGTPKASTPSGSRAGSVGPRGHPGASKKGTMPRRPLVQQALQRRKLGKHKSKSSRRLLGGGSRASPATTTGDELSADAESGSEDGDYQSQDGKKEEADMDEASDDTKYCYCHDVSHGDMIACDNADCAIQWFHWTCAGITSEPQGEWLCRECRKLPKDKIKKS